MTLLIAYWIILVLFVTNSKGDVTEEALEFLSTFGYYKRNNKDVGSMLNKNEVENSVKTFQKFSGLPVTGVLDETTQNQMKKTRCGIKDVINEKREKRFALQNTKWKKNALIWKLLNNNNDGLSRNEVESILQRALSKWQVVSGLKFYKSNTNSKADIEFKFVEADHGDGYPFKPYQKVYAHGFFPLNNDGLSGDVHFNDVYNFNIKEKQGISLLYVALHELGHSLGLEHSAVQSSVMNPIYNGIKDENSIALHEDDILGIQTLYAKCENSICSSNAKCDFRNGTLSCMCKDSYTGDGKICYELCDTKVCNENAYCKRSSNTQDCVCFDNFEGDGVECAIKSYLPVDETVKSSSPFINTQLIKTTTSSSPVSTHKQLIETSTSSSPVSTHKQLIETSLPPSPAPEIKKVSVFIIIIAILVPILVFVIFGALWLCRKKLISRTSIWNTDMYIYENYKGYDKLSPDEWEIYSDKIILEKKLGEGLFGNVFLSKMNGKVLARTNYFNKSEVARQKDSNINVAVKLVKDRATQSEFDDFVEEINLMKEIGYHKNILSMVGCCTQKKPFCLVVEYMENGDLLQFLRKRRSISTRLHKVPLDEMEVITPDDLLNFAWQVASGMEYISSIKLVHRDLAARNILVGSNKNLKISDFGLTRKVNDELKYFGKKTRRLPVRWMSIEAIFDHTFTSYSDVWAYGVVLFEIITLGGTPYPALNNCELLARLKTGYRMDRPDNCSLPMYDIMMHCWNENPLHRPTFAELRKQFEEIMSRDVSYFNLEINEENTYYKVASFHSISSEENDDEKENEKEEYQKSIKLKSINKTKKVTNTNTGLLKIV